MAETWRVVLATGEVREVRVSFEPYPGAVNDEPCQYVARCDDAEAESTASAHDAALWLASCHEWVAVEILAPGDLTRAELRAQAFREGAEAMRESILDHLPCVTAERDECAARIHRVGVPPCPEVSR